MARFSEGMIFNVTPLVLKKACMMAVGDLDLFQLESDRDRILSRERIRFDTYNQVDIELLFEDGPHGTELRINGENEGIGPFQEHHVRAKVMDLMNRIQADLDILDDKIPVNDTGEITNELRMLSDLHVKGVITDVEFLRAKKRLLGDRM